MVTLCACVKRVLIDHTFTGHHHRHCRTKKKKKFVVVVVFVVVGDRRWPLGLFFFPSTGLDPARTRFQVSRAKIFFWWAGGGAGGGDGTRGAAAHARRASEASEPVPVPVRVQKQ